jgi:hypothetical protein
MRGILWSKSHPFVPFLSHFLPHSLHLPLSRAQTALRVDDGQKSSSYSSKQAACQRLLLGLPVFVTPTSELHQRHVPSGTESNHSGFGGIRCLVTNQFSANQTRVGVLPHDHLTTLQFRGAMMQTTACRPRSADSHRYLCRYLAMHH